MASPRGPRPRGHERAVRTSERAYRSLCGGVALYLRAHNAFKLRDVGSVSVHQRLAATAVSLALILAAVRVPALLILAATATILVALASNHRNVPNRPYSLLTTQATFDCVIRSGP